ncbi:TetR family transcriptional regulator [Microtetraspora sp. NBRC 13810]|uniref:TetR/AcrR family transcriptional regulator n=1 Tax=Microtetraspora sp. NBRC 13810 TaxID=3030990 RepID=UPI0024A32678|nr:TetR/AcrR family transcriptional regulator [Microtetraspora sp. NBRC 13810]GLW07678.1 TetR family transcriptional regulator [Microtetraspora sp. NBRC 13810]
MTSNRHNTDSVGDILLDATRECVLAVGVRRTTLTDVARRAGLSRMTIYRHWPDVRGLVAALMTREWVEVAGRVRADDPVDAVVSGVRALRAHPLWRKIVEVDPELLLPYLLQRRGGSHDAMLALIEHHLAEGRARGVVRGGPPLAAMARTVLLTAQSFLLSAPTMTDPPGGGGVAIEDLDAELAAVLDRYLRP